MKRFLLIISLTLIAFNSFSQIQDDNTIVSFGLKVSILDVNAGNQLIGIDIEHFVSDRFSLNYSLYVGDNYVHIPGGLLLGILVLAYVPDLEGTIYSVLIPEGVTFNIMLMDRFYIAPYFNPLGFEYHWDDPDDNEIQFIGTAGFKLKGFLSHNFLIAPFVEAQQDFLNSDWGARAGINIGVKF